MREVVVAAILIWSSCIVQAFEEVRDDYWYSNDDGMISGSLTPISHFSNNDNLSELRIENGNSTSLEEHSQRKKSWFLHFEKHFSSPNVTGLRSNRFRSSNFEPVLMKLDKSRTPQETSGCIKGTSFAQGCNNCVCMGGQLYLCTAKRCVTSDSKGHRVLMSYHEKKKDVCVEGERIESFDCNTCWCSGGIIMCTVIKCGPNNNKAMKQLALKRPANKRLAKKGFAAQRSSLKKSYHSPPGEKCVRGEKIPNKGCNKCWCFRGVVRCDSEKCEGQKSTTRRLRKPYSGSKNKKCEPGQRLPSPDNCNTCRCNKDGNIFCTVMSCGVEPRMLKGEKLGCIPKTWYSLSDVENCNECYCVDGKMSFCYMKLCEGMRARDTGYSPKKLMSLMYSGTCKKGAVMFDECSKCICTYKEEWKCFTRLTPECQEAAKSTKNPNRNTKPPKTKTKTPWTPRTKGPRTKSPRTKNPGTKSPKNKNPTTKYPKNKNPKTKSPKTKSPKTKSPGTKTPTTDTPQFTTPEDSETGRGLKPGDECEGNYQVPSLDNCNKCWCANNRVSCTVDCIEPPLKPDEGNDYMLPRDEDEDGNDYITPKYSDEYPKSTHIGNNYEDDEDRTHGTEYTVEPSLNSNEDPRRPGQTQKPDWYDGENDDVYQKPDVNGSIEENDVPSKIIEPDSPIDYYDDNDEDDGIPMDRECSKGEYFTQGHANNCQGCYCTTLGHWTCFSVAGACRGYDTRSCTAGAYQKNNQKPCSVCYCGANGKFMCATDENCAQGIQGSPCNSIQCADSCRQKRSLHGFCHQDKCQCV